MENTTWDQKLHCLTHILTSPTFTPSLHSQFFISSQIPCYLNWDYPPLLCHHSPAFPPPLLKWAFFQFLNRIHKFGYPTTSWRSKCPYQVPPPLILANGVEEAKWDDEGKREYARGRFRKRKKVESNVHPLIPILVPNLLLFSLLLWDPIPNDENNVFSS